MGGDRSTPGFKGLWESRRVEFEVDDGLSLILEASDERRY